MDYTADALTAKGCPLTQHKQTLIETSVAARNIIALPFLQRMDSRCFGVVNAFEICAARALTMSDSRTDATNDYAGFCPDRCQTRCDRHPLGE